MATRTPTTPSWMRVRQARNAPSAVQRLRHHPHAGDRGRGQQTVPTVVRRECLGFDVGEFVHINLGDADEEYVQVLAADPGRADVHCGLHQEPFDRRDRRPTIWPTPILNEGDSLAFDILAVASRTRGAT